MAVPLQLVAFLILTYLYGSLAEYCIHRWLMHEKKYTPSLFRGHALHHSTYNRGSFTKPKDLTNKYRSLVLCLEHLLVFTLPLALFVLPWFPLWSLILVGFGFFHYFAYNHLHSAMHLSRPPKYFPKWYAKICYRIHLMHHSHPQSWFNVALPGMDCLLGTTVEESWADKQRWEEIESKMFLRARAVDLQKDKEIIRSLNDCIFPSKYSEVGFVAPPPSGKAEKFGDWLAKLTVDVFVGDVQVVWLGVNYPKTAVYALSHKSWRDVAISRAHLPKGRIMAAQSVMQFCGGLLGLILGPFWGAWAAAPGRGIAVKAGISILKTGSNVHICPEGWAYMSEGPLKPFQNGAVRIALGAGVPLVPVYIKYGASAPKCFDKLWFPLQVLLNAIDPFQRATAFIVVGHPYSLPADCDVAAETIKLREVVQSLEPRM